MQEDNLNTEENILQQNYQINVPINNVYPTIQDPPKYSPPPQGYQVYQPPNNQMVGQMIQSQQVNQNQQNVAVNNAPKAVNYSSWEIFSFISWLLFMSAKWDMHRKVNSISESNYKPIVYNRTFIELINLIISIIGFLVYVQNIIYKRNKAFYDSLFGLYTKLHVFPLLFYSVINMILDDDIITQYGRSSISSSSSYDPLPLLSFYLIFTIFCLVFIIIVYYCTEMNCDWYMIMAIKKGVYSMLIVDCSYRFFESIFYLRDADIAKLGYLEIPLQRKNLYKGAGIAFSLLQGIIVIVLSLCFKDIIMPILNFLMYYGMVFNFYTKNSEAERKEYTATVVIEIIMVVVHFFFIIFMLAKYKEKLIQS